MGNDRGVDGAKLEALCRSLAGRRTKAFLVMRHDRVVCEWYAPDHGADRRHYTASLAKSLVAGMALALALGDDRLRPDDPACRYIPGWRDHPWKSRVTIEHLATHSSGLEDAETPGKGHFDQGGWKEAFWRREVFSHDPFSISLSQAPTLFEPGRRFAYSNPGMAALGYAITASLRGAPREDIRALLRERVMLPLGIPDREWSIGYGQPSELDGMRLYATWGGGEYTARAVARVGQLLLHGGEWQGRRLLHPGWLRRLLAHPGGPLPPRAPDNPWPAPALCFWSNDDAVWPELPRDACAGAGAGNQVLLFVPSLDLVAVRMGELLGDPAQGETFWGGLHRHLLAPLAEAVVGRRPLPAPPSYPPSSLTRGVEWAPADTIARAAPNSDNWPITWTADGEQFTSYGDGWGFEPYTERKLSQGFARIVGGPEGFLGENIRATSGETEGDGLAGPKASGMVAIDGVLYMWVRNTGNATLVSSADGGVNWEGGFRMETSFGCPAFLNFGRDYAGAASRSSASALCDGYVYTYSPDGPSAYEPYDSLVLARVPKELMRERQAYEFLRGLDERGLPKWTPEVAERGAGFAYPGHCQRPDAVYHPGLGRYLLALGYNHHGGWGIYEAPEPWGPWSVVFHTEGWGLGNTHGYRLPAKWIGEDNRTLWLVFSGRTYDGVMYDAFCLRRLTLDVEHADERG